MTVQPTERGRAPGWRSVAFDARTPSRHGALACRDAFLDWCYAWTKSKGYIPDIDGFSNDVRSHFEGASFTRGRNRLGIRTPSRHRHDHRVRK